MSESTVLQLRQQESTNVMQNGVWETTLDHPVELEAGDQVSVKAVYLDTVTDVIDLAEDTPVTMEAAMYIQNGTLDQQYPFGGKITDPGVPSPLRIYHGDITKRTPNEAGDNHLWWLSTVHDLVGSTNWNLPNIIVTPINKTSSTKRFGDIILEFEYTPITPGAVSTVQSVHITSKIDKTYHSHNPWPLGISCTGSATAPAVTLKTSRRDLEDAGIESVDWETNQVLLVAGEPQVEIQRFPLSFIVPRGVYTPAEIGQYITDKVNNLQYSGAVDIEYPTQASPTNINKTNWPSMNPWLQTIMKNQKDINDVSGGLSAQLFVNADTDYGGTIGGGKQYLKYDLVKMLDEFIAGKIGAPPAPGRPFLDKFVGTNQFSMTFDLDENKLKIEQMHFPMYVNGTGANDALPGIEFTESASDDSSPFQSAGGITTAYSGIAFTSLTPASFWNTLGFGTITIQPVKNVKMNYPLITDPIPTSNNSYTISSAVGVNYTAAFLGLDLPVVHNDAWLEPKKMEGFFGQYSVPRYDLMDSSTQDVNTSDISSVFSDAVMNDSIADEGYFLIDVASNFKQNMVGGRLVGTGGTSKDTQSIVNRYFSTQGFTSDTGAGSIVYDHVGEPAMLSNFSIKVKSPNGNFIAPTTLRTKNTVFIEIIKAIKEPNQTK
tara:strand:+ start:172 stop:2148 length:1977 start_codon:yes stop_codon:yes gene_type:complete